MIEEFAVVWDHRDKLLNGFQNTIILVAISAVGALVLGALLSTVLMARRPWLARLGRLYVDAMRCVPFLLFAYIIYYGLPGIGITMSKWSAGLTALIVYNMAYMAELLRAAWASLPKETIEAGHAFGFHGLGLFRRVILPPVVFAAVPMIGNQVIQIVKDSSFLTIIAVTELTYAANSIQTTSFIPFGAFVAAIALYWVICMVIETTVGIVGRFAEMRR